MKFQSKATATFLTPDELYQFEHGKQSLSRPSDEIMEIITLDDVECLPYDKRIEIKKGNFQICKLIPDMLEMRLKFLNVVKF